MPVRLRCFGFSSQGQMVEGGYLKSFDVDAHDGRGEAIFTGNPAEAMKFNDLTAAMNAWRTESNVRPLRDDGKPNRPLSALTVEIEPC